MPGYNERLKKIKGRKKKQTSTAKQQGSSAKKGNAGGKSSDDGAKARTSESEGGTPPDKEHSAAVSSEQTLDTGASSQINSCASNADVSIKTTEAANINPIAKSSSEGLSGTESKMPPGGQVGNDRKTANTGAVPKTVSHKKETSSKTAKLDASEVPDRPSKKQAPPKPRTPKTSLSEQGNENIQRERKSQSERNIVSDVAPQHPSKSTVKSSPITEQYGNVLSECTQNAFERQEAVKNKSHITEARQPLACGFNDPTPSSCEMASSQEAHNSTINTVSNTARPVGSQTHPAEPTKSKTSIARSALVESTSQTACRQATDNMASKEHVHLPAAEAVDGTKNGGISQAQEGAAKKKRKKRGKKGSTQDDLKVQELSKNIATYAAVTQSAIRQPTVKSTDKPTSLPTSAKPMAQTTGQSNPVPMTDGQAMAKPATEAKDKVKGTTKKMETSDEKFPTLTLYWKEDLKTSIRSPPSSEAGDSKEIGQMEIQHPVKTRSLEGISTISPNRGIGNQQKSVSTSIIKQDAPITSKSITGDEKIRQVQSSYDQTGKSIRLAPGGSTHLVKHGGEPVLVDSSSAAVSSFTRQDMPIRRSLEQQELANQRSTHALTSTLGSSEKNKAEATGTSKETKESPPGAENVPTATLKHGGADVAEEQAVETQPSSKKKRRKKKKKAGEETNDASDVQKTRDNKGSATETGIQIQFARENIDGSTLQTGNIDLTKQHTATSGEPTVTQVQSVKPGMNTSVTPISQERTQLKGTDRGELKSSNQSKTTSQSEITKQNITDEEKLRAVGFGQASAHVDRNTTVETKLQNAADSKRATQSNEGGLETPRSRNPSEALEEDAKAGTTSASSKKKRKRKKKSKSGEQSEVSTYDSTIGSPSGISQTQSQIAPKTVSKGLGSVDDLVTRDSESKNRGEVSAVKDTKGAGKLSTSKSASQAMSRGMMGKPTGKETTTPKDKGTNHKSKTSMNIKENNENIKENVICNKQAIKTKAIKSDYGKPSESSQSPRSHVGVGKQTAIAEIEEDDHGANIVRPEAPYMNSADTEVIVKALLPRHGATNRRMLRDRISHQLVGNFNSRIYNLYHKILDMDRKVASVSSDINFQSGRSKLLMQSVS